MIQVFEPSSVRFLPRAALRPLKQNLVEVDDDLVTMAQIFF